MTGHAQLKFVMTECSKTQIHLTGLICTQKNTVECILNTRGNHGQEKHKMANRKDHNWATPWENVSLGVSDQARHKLACAATKSSWSLEISAIESRDIILSKQRTTKALIKLRRCTGWSAPLLLAYDIRHIFSWPCSIILHVFTKKKANVKTTILILWVYRSWRK